MTTVMSNLGLYKAIEANGMHSVQTAVGDRHVVEEMRAHGTTLVGSKAGTSSSLITTTPGMAC